MAYRGCDLILSCHEAEQDHANMRENNISQPGDLQPGQLIIIHVKEVK